MTQPLVECVPNISEGRDLARVQAVINAMARVPGILLLHSTSDPDHNRSVITFAGSPDAITEAAFQAVAKAAEVIDLNQHRGIHPRLGALDVLPFVPLADTDLQSCAALAHSAGQRIWTELQIPVYFYAAAARHPGRQRLEDVRRGQFEGLREAAPANPSKQPDLGGPGLHASAGAVICGARKILIAYNINLRSDDLAMAKALAAAIRERNGGLPGVKALGLPLHSRGLVQISMNITDHELAPLRNVYAVVEKLAAAYGVSIEESELIGLAPRSALAPGDANYLKLVDFNEDRYIESRIAAARSPTL
jgi:glutamate formiminotransferase/glutamate formiminotransferase/formiminotetrahydrofolate cyclodeaminase